MTQDELKKEIHYNPATGIFTWLRAKQGRILGQLPSRTKNGNYKEITINHKRYRSARLAVFYMTGQWPADEVDHEDHDRQNDAWSNLQKATPTQNQRNQSKSAANTSGVTGVSKHPTISSKWRAFITLENKTKYLGTFAKFQKAVAVRKAAEVMYDFHPNHGK